MKRPRFNALINHPCFGSLWMRDVHLVDGFVEGHVWDTSNVGSPYYPDDYSGENYFMNFPIRCIRKVEKVMPPVYC